MVNYIVSVRLVVYLTARALSCCIVCAFSPIHFISSAAADTPPQPIASYRIEVQLTLDEKQRPANLQGREQLTWLNDSPDTITDLQFHLYLNAFKNEKSTFFKESGGQLRSDTFQPGEWGWIDVNEMRIAGGEDLTSKIEFIHPDDENADDRTVVRVPLSKPVKPGEKITLDITFNARLPRVFARTGYAGQFALVAQWFPKIGVWEQVGERRRAQAGWNCHQFHAISEFYADFGNYDVTMTIPSIYKGKIGATGKMQSERVNMDGTVTYHFIQENVHDFAWTVDPNYIVTTRSFKAHEQVAQREIDEWSKRLNIPREQVGLRDVSITLLIQREHRSQIDRHFKAAFNAIKYFGLWYGRYPYVTLTIVDPPYHGEGAGGMEYPTFFTAGTSWWPGRDQNPEEVIVHEFGHQYWQGLVASNEFEEPWLDEGFTTYSTAKVLKAAYGPNVLSFHLGGIPWFYLPMELPHPYEDRIFTLRGEFKDPILTPTWKVYDADSSILNSYPRAGLVLNTLEGYLGEELMASVMRQYYQKWRYRHPASQDFFDTVYAVTGKDLSWFFDQFVKTTGTLDYEIADAKSTKIKNDNTNLGHQGFETEVAVRRMGQAWFPVDLLFTFKDGTRIIARPAMVRDGVIDYRLESSKDGREWIENWAISDNWKKFKFITSSELALAQLDPAGKILLDANLTNNSIKPSATGAGAAFRWGSGAIFWLQAILQTLSAVV